MKTRSIQINNKTFFLHPQYVVNAMHVASEYLDALAAIFINSNDDNHGRLASSAQIRLLSLNAHFDKHLIFNTDNINVLIEQLTNLRARGANCQTIIDAHKTSLIINTRDMEPTCAARTPIDEINALDLNIFSDMINFANSRSKGICDNIIDALQHDALSRLPRIILKEYNLSPVLYKQYIYSDLPEYNRDALDIFINDNYLRLTGVCKETNNPYLQLEVITDQVFSFLTLTDVHHYPIDIMEDMPEVPLYGEMLELVCDYM